MFTDPYLNAFDLVLKDLGVTAYLCGGTVRDLLLQRPIHDIDLVLSHSVIDVAKKFAASMRRPYFVMDRERRVVRVVCETGNWDLTGFRNGSIEGDLKKRDFTVNAMAILWDDFYPSRSTARVIDPFSGQDDMNRRLVRPVDEVSLSDDPLRILRAFRIAAELNFEMDPSVTVQMDQVHDSITRVAEERITEELDRILLQPEAARVWKALGERPVFDSLFPELKPMKGCEQGGYHHLDVWEHSVEALAKLETLLSSLSEHFPEHEAPLQEYLNSVAGTLDRRRLLKWAILLHDMGKPQTRELREEGRWKFHGHEHTGEELAEGFLKRLKFAKKDAQVICLLINQHLRPLQFFNQVERSPDDFFRFFRKLGTEALGAILVAYGDIAASRGPLANPARNHEFLILAQDLLLFYFKVYYPAVNTPELVKGRDLMAVLQMKPGPDMGQLLKEIRELQLSGALQSREQALDYARAWKAETK